MGFYRAYITNCPIIGESMSTVGDSSYLNEINLHLDKFDLKIIEVPQIVTKNFNEFKGRNIHTTDLLIENIADNQFDDADQLASDVTSLLSLATCSIVTKFGYEFNNSKTVNATVGQLQHFIPLINTKDGSLIRKFLELTWPAHNTLKNCRKLNIAFQYFVWSQLNGQPIELNLVTTFVLYEHLKYTFALQKGYPFIRGYFRLHGATTSKPGESKKFRELLYEMFKAVRMNPNLDAIISLRDDLIHSGISKLTLPEYIDIYSKCHDILREYLLKLLQYSGPYFSYSSPNTPIVI